MVDQADLMRVGMLNGEWQQIASAIDIFDSGGKIINMTVGVDMSLPQGRAITIQTQAMDYPQAMVEAIKNFLSSREQEIRNELADLGVTGVASSPNTKGASK